MGRECWDCWLSPHLLGTTAWFPGQRKFVVVHSSWQMGKLGQRGEVTPQSWNSCLNSQFIGLLLPVVLETKNNLAVQKREFVRTG